MTKEESIIYAAGLFDGEGWISIVGIVKRREYRLVVGLTMTDSRPIIFLNDWFGGDDRSDAMYHTYTGKPVYRWVLHATNAMDFLKLIKPFSITKKEKIDLAIEFQERKNKDFGQRLSDEIILHRHLAYERMKLLNG